VQPASPVQPDEAFISSYVGSAMWDPLEDFTTAARQRVLTSSPPGATRLRVSFFRSLAITMARVAQPPSGLSGFPISVIRVDQWVKLPWFPDHPITRRSSRILPAPTPPGLFPILCWQNKATSQIDPCVAPCVAPWVALGWPLGGPCSGPLRDAWVTLA